MPSRTSGVMPPGMLMRSEAFASSLYAPQPGYTVKDYCRRKGIPYQPVGMRLRLETFVDYALWFQNSLVSHVRRVDVSNLQRADGLFHLSLTDGSSLTTRRVVIALGLKGFAKTPPVLESLPRQYASHSVEYGPLTWAQNKTIAIVGGGQSALGLAALLHEVGARVRVFAREASVTWNEPPDTSRGWISKLLTPQGGLGPGWRSHIVSEYPFVFHALNGRRRKEVVESSWGPSGAWWLRDRVIDKIDVRTRCHLRHVSVENDQLILRLESEGKESCVLADHVIAATGFKVDIRRLTFLSDEINDSIVLNDGAPELTENFETSVRSLYVIGPTSAYSFGPAMRFIYGAKYASPRVAKHINKAFRREVKNRGLATNGARPRVEMES
jgi:FAD-dependent urate hydroxylase